MIKTNALVIGAFFCVLGGTPLYAAEVIQGVEVPSLEDMKDPHAVCGCGLNLDLVHQRQSALRGRLGVGDDITTAVQGLERDKGVILRDLQEKHTLLGEKGALVQQKEGLEEQRAQTSKLFSHLQRRQLKEDIAQLAERIVRIDGQLTGLEARIGAMKHSVDIKKPRIMAAFGLTAEQVAKIPGAA